MGGHVHAHGVPRLEVHDAVALGHDLAGHPGRLACGIPVQRLLLAIGRARRTRGVSPGSATACARLLAGAGPLWRTTFATAVGGGARYTRLARRDAALKPCPPRRDVQRAAVKGGSVPVGLPATPRARACSKHQSSAYRSEASPSATVRSRSMRKNLLDFLDGHKCGGGRSIKGDRRTRSRHGRGTDRCSSPACPLSCPPAPRVCLG
jgi:hypothetical protein